ncbi:MAG: 23S rRNA (adenine(2503)-C(2))-methyltransferase RlmN [Deltaproteobacteria bacterium]|nr:23S rRNA (adenine(2503)-C(2))-methyltransferase RlmN [Deltaproteobacteria bacterium]
MTQEKIDVRSLSLEELTDVVARLGERGFRAKQLFRWIHHKGVGSFDAMTDLSKGFRQLLNEKAQLDTLTLDLVQQSSDGTRKYRFKTFDGRFIESVYMPDNPGEAPFETADDLDDDEAEDAANGVAQSGGAAGPGDKGGHFGDGWAPTKTRVRRTLCVSTQVGCAMGCRFCMTATMGLVRNLTPGEITDQVYRVNEDLRSLGIAGMNEQRPLTNLVYMGMGEPLHNYANVKKSLELLLHEQGANFSHRHVTVSTSGLVPNILKLGEETQVKLAVSLNATTDEQREKLMPVDKKWDISALLEACRAFPMKYGRRITFEYVMLRDVNDSEADAERLCQLLQGLPSKVNLIPYNENPGLGFGDPGMERVNWFRRYLEGKGFTAMIRRNRGRDISAACGQLAVAGQKKEREARA